MKLIDKDALIAEITHKIKVLEAFVKNFDGISDKVEKAKNKIEALGDTLLFIENFEVKEVDLDKELNKYFIINNLIAADIQFEPVTQMKKCAKYFFELGIKVQKGD